jgi:hypothetical protein
VTVQDDERERELVRLFNLDWDPAHQRSGVDATLSLALDGQTRRIDVEVKSTTGDTVSTARDVGMEHIAKWRSKLFVIGFYSRDARRPELRSCLCLTPADMKPWIDGIEAKIGFDHRIAERAAAGLGLSDVHAVLGRHERYTIEQARAVLRHRALYIAQRGSTLNNPHIGKQHLAPFLGTDREVHADWAAVIRRIATVWPAQVDAIRASAGDAAS